MIKTLGDLQSKSWYRFIKVLYIGFFAIFGIYTYINDIMGDVDFESWKMLKLFLLLILYLLAEEILRRLFYYIVLGTFRPKKK